MQPSDVTLLVTSISAAVSIVLTIANYLFARDAKMLDQTLRLYVDQRLMHERAWIDRSLKATDARIQNARDIRLKIVHQRIEDVRQYRMRLTIALNEIYLFSQHLRFIGPIAPMQNVDGTYSPLRVRMPEKTLERLERCMASIAAAPSAGGFLPQEIIDKGTEFLATMHSCVCQMVASAALAEHDERESADQETQTSMAAIGRESQALFGNWETKMQAAQEKLLLEIESSEEPIAALVTNSIAAQ